MRVRTSEDVNFEQFLGVVSLQHTRHKVYTIYKLYIGIYVHYNIIIYVCVYTLPTHTYMLYIVYRKLLKYRLRSDLRFRVKICYCFKRTRM